MIKQKLYLIAGIIFIIIIGVVSYKIMNDHGYFDHQAIPGTEDMTLIPLTSLLWAFLKQLIKTLLVIIIGFIILAGLGTAVYI